MGEFLFVAKCFVLAVLLTVFLQTNVGSETIEMKAQNWVQTGAAPKYLKTVAQGAVKAFNNGYKVASQFITEKMETAGAAEKASRLHFQFKRNDKVESESTQD